MKKLIVVSLATLLLGISGSIGVVSANDDPQQYTVELFPAPLAYRMGGFPPGMTRQSFTAAQGSVVITLIDEQRTKLEFNFAGLIPNGVYTMWNVLTPKPEFSDEPLGPTGYGKHGVIADHTGRAHAVVYLDKRPGVMFLLDYHADGALKGKKGVVNFPGALWGEFPKF